MLYSDNTTEDMSRLTEIMDALDAASKNTTVPHNIRLAAENADSVIKLVQESNITDAKFIQLVDRAASTAVDAYEQCKCMTSKPGSVLPQTIRDDARKLANLLNSMEEKCIQLSKEELGSANEDTEFVNKINEELDKLFVFENARVSDTNTSTINTTRPSNPRIVTEGGDLAMIVNSGGNKNTKTIVNDSGERKDYSHKSIINRPDSGLNSGSRIFARASRVFVLDSGNDEISEVHLPKGSTSIPLQNSRSKAVSMRALDVFSQNLERDLDDLPHVADRMARRLGSTTRKSQRHRAHASFRRL